MELKGIKVVHQQFGKGKVLEQTGRALTIQFEDGVTRRMAYPQAFRMGLSAADKKVNQAMNAEADAHRQEAEDAKQERLARFAEDYKALDKKAEKERKEAEAKERKAAEARERKAARAAQKKAEAEAKAEKEEKEEKEAKPKKAPAKKKAATPKAKKPAAKKEEKQEEA